MSDPKPKPCTLEQMEDPIDRLMAAMSIMQMAYLASDTTLAPEKIFGSFFFKEQGLEVAIRLLETLIGDIEDLQAQTKKTGGAA